MAQTRLPSNVGAGFRPEHFDALVAAPGPLGFIEIHAENYMGAGGRPHLMLSRLRELYPISIHGVGLSIGGAGPLDRAHLERVKILCDRYQPASFSEHLAWSTHNGAYLNDLLPLPYTDETLRTVVDHIDEVQTFLGRKILLENPSTYLRFDDSTWREQDFLNEIAVRSGCGLLLDINNIFVSATNHQLDPLAYFDAFPIQLVGEIHLGGHAQDEDDDGSPLLIDSHSAPVADPVWALYAEAIMRLGRIPTLIEWDNDVPEWPILRRELERANHILAVHSAGEVA